MEVSAGTQEASSATIAVSAILAVMFLISLLIIIFLVLYILRLKKMLGSVKGTYMIMTVTGSDYGCMCAITVENVWSVSED